MRILRYIVAIVIGICAIPIVCMAFAWCLARLSGCIIDFETETACRVAPYELGRVIDSAISIGIYSPLSFGLAAFVFASWVIIELLRIIIRSH